MNLYVFALVDAAPDGGLGRGLRAPLRARPSAGAFAIVERRADVPPAELGSLRAHQAVVSRLAKAVPAILPVRFGTLLEEQALDEVLNERDEDIAEALALVRHRVQFTLRAAGPGRRSATAEGGGAARGADRQGGRSARGPRSAPLSGVQYLRQAARATSTAPPAAFRVVRDRLHAFVVREAFQASANGMPDTLYQLIEKTAVDRYRAMADALMLTTPALSVSGPWPPFAFAPELL